MFDSFRERARARRRHYQTMPRRSQFVFFLGVACTFGTMGVVSDLVRLESTTTPRLIISILSTSLFSAAWAFLGVRAQVKWMPVLFACQIATFWALNRLLPVPHHNLSGQQWQDAILLHTALIQAFVISGYALFFAFFGTEGQRFRRPHRDRTRRHHPSRARSATRRLAAVR